MHLHAKDRQGLLSVPQAKRKAWNRSPLEPSERMALLTP